MELWVEKYRPQTLEEYVGNETIKNKIADYLKQGSIQNLLFHGVAGTGKTTLAKLIAKNLNCDLLYINASDERGIDTIRDKIIPFASSMSFNDVKIKNCIKNLNLRRRDRTTIIALQHASPLHDGEFLPCRSADKRRVVYSSTKRAYESEYPKERCKPHPALYRIRCINCMVIIRTYGTNSDNRGIKPLDFVLIRGNRARKSQHSKHATNTNSKQNGTYKLGGCALIERMVRLR